MAEQIITQDMKFGERVDMALFKNKMTRRELIEGLKDYGIEFTDTKLSNRCAGVNDFKEEEIKAIEKFFKKQKIEF